MGLDFDTAVHDKKCYKVYFKGLADCYGDKDIVTSSLSVVEDGLVLSEHYEIVRATFLPHQNKRNESTIGFI